MHELIHFALQHGHPLLFAFVLAEQIGLPLPALPILLAFGALIGQDYFGFAPALLLAAGAATGADLLWFGLGRVRGHAVIRMVCRLSLEPDSCVRRTSDLFGRRGLPSLLFAKFVPGFSTAAPPLAGASGVSVWRFAAWDFAGSLLWAGGFLSLGAIFSSELERIAAQSMRLGSWLLAILALGLAAYIAGKYAQRRRVMRSLRVDRITPEELKKRLDAGEDVLIVDLRHSLEFEAAPATLPSAVRIRPDELEALPSSLPLDREVVLYCT